MTGKSQNSRGVPSGYRRIQIVDNLRDLFNTPFGGPDQVNCVYFPRTLKGDFNALARAVLKRNEWAARRLPGDFDEIRVRGSMLGIDSFMDDGARVAYDEIVSDIAMIDAVKDKKFWWSPACRVVYPNTYTEDFVRKFHADTITTPAGRVLCAYNDPVTEILEHDDISKVAHGRQTYETAYHHAADVNLVRPRPGDLFRIAGEDMAAVTPPLVHRAPAMPDAGSVRFLLVANGAWRKGVSP